MKLINNHLLYKIIDYEIWEKGFLGVINGSRRMIKKFVLTSFFDNTIMITVYKVYKRW